MAGVLPVPMPQHFTPPLTIAQEYQGLGLFRIMLESSKELARSWNSDSICLHVQREAQDVAQIYNRFGYIRDPRGDTMISGHALDGYLLGLKPTQHIAEIQASADRR